MSLKRLDWILSHRGLGTRRDVQKMIRNGLVSVSGQTLTDPKRRIAISSHITVDSIEVAPLPLLFVWHKPLNVVSTMRDPYGRADLSGVMPDNIRSEYHPVGRLDRDTSGLLLFSRCGVLTQYSLHPKNEVDRRYIATVEGEPDDSLRSRLRDGIETTLGTFPAQIEKTDGSAITLTVNEGKHRMVRRILANAGYPVRALHRTQYGPLKLLDLPLDQIRPATSAEMDTLKSMGAPISV